MPRRPFIPDPPHVIARRTKLAEKIRAILLGTFPAHAPLDGSGQVWRTGKKVGQPMTAAEARGKRISAWAWKVREFVQFRTFRYVELLREANAMVAEHGGPFPPVDYAGDDVLLRAWESRVCAKRKAEGRQLRGVKECQNKERVVRDKIAQRTKSALIAGICPLCAEPLPCAACSVPAVKFDGRGGLVAVPTTEGAR